MNDDNLDNQQIQGSQPEDPKNDPAAAKDSNDWTTGDEAMTAPQASYLQTLCQEAGEQFDPNLSKADASKKIEELQQKTGRGQDTSNEDQDLPLKTA